MKLRKKAVKMCSLQGLATVTDGRIGDLFTIGLKGRSHYNDKLHDNDNDKGGKIGQ